MKAAGPPPATGVDHRPNRAEAPHSPGFARRLRQMRRQSRLSLEDLQGKTGLSKSYLSKIERGLKVPSIAATLKLAKALGVPVGHLFGETTDEAAICVVRRHERRAVSRRGAAHGYGYEALAYKRSVKRMDAFIMRPPRRFEDDTLFEHEGEELIFVLRGRVEVVFAGRTVVLDAGDSLYFDGHLLHRSRSLGRARAETLVVIGSV